MKVLQITKLSNEAYVHIIIVAFLFFPSTGFSYLDVPMMPTDAAVPGLVVQSCGSVGISGSGGPAWSSIYSGPGPDPAALLQPQPSPRATRYHSYCVNVFGKIQENWLNFLLCSPGCGSLLNAFSCCSAVPLCNTTGGCSVGRYWCHLLEACVPTSSPCSPYDSAAGGRNFDLPPRYPAVPPFYHLVADLPLRVSPSSELKTISVSRKHS